MILFGDRGRSIGKILLHLAMLSAVVLGSISFCDVSIVNVTSVVCLVGLVGFVGLVDLFLPPHLLANLARVGLAGVVSLVSLASLASLASLVCPDSDGFCCVLDVLVMASAAFLIVCLWLRW